MYVCSYFKFSFVIVVVVFFVCVRLGSLSVGKSIYFYVIKSGWVSVIFVGNVLVFMYVKCGCVYDGVYGFFFEIDEKDVVLWNVIIVGFVENEFYKDVYVLFRKMLLGFIVLNYLIIASILFVFFLLDRDVVYRLG